AGRLFDGDGGSGGFERVLCLVRRVLGNLLQDRLRGCLDQLFGLLEAETGQAAYLLDDLDLLITCGLQDDVEFVLLLYRGRLGAWSPWSSRCDRHGCGSGHAEGLLELLNNLAELQGAH